MRSAEQQFPWLIQLSCGCQFTRLEVTDGSLLRNWDPCGCHIVLAAQGYQPGWPPVIHREREPVTV